jgi:hypothetical protein
MSKPSLTNSRAPWQRGVDGILRLVVSCTVLSCHIACHMTAMSDLGNQGWHSLFLLHLAQREFHNKSPCQYGWQHIVIRGHCVRDSQISTFFAKRSLYLIPVLVFLTGNLFNMLSTSSGFVLVGHLTRYTCVLKPSFVTWVFPPPPSPQWRNSP